MAPPSSKPTPLVPRFDPIDLTPAPEQAGHNHSISSMLKIESLLNPSAAYEIAESRMPAHSSAFSPPLTPALTSTTSTSSFSPRMHTPDTFSPAKRQKLVKDAPVFVKGDAKGQVHYAPLESNEDTISLAPWQRDELLQQHHRFRIYPSGNEKDGLISDFTRHIPYSSDKKDFFGKAGFEGFDVFQYTFIVPEDPTRKEHTVMWDYKTGLVRVTPFFKACKYSKTTPAKALNTNPGLREMSQSITGGALVAQGYWMPYSCARAVCLTFAYPIRWALTPIFGPSFVRECLQPNHAGFARFKVDSETIRCAEMAMEGLKNGAQPQQEIPRSIPDEHHHHVQHAHQVRPVFKAGSPFDSESDISNASNSYGLAAYSAVNSPAISPRSNTFESSGWTAVNQHAHITRNTQPSAPPNTRVSSLETSLLTQPPHASWRPAQNATAGASATTSIKRTRHSSAGDDDYYSDNVSTSSSNGSSETEDTVTKAYAKPTLRGKAAHRRQQQESPYTAASRSATPPLKKSKKYTAEDYRAARLLLELSAGGSIDEGSAMQGPGTGKGNGRSKW